MTGRRTLVPPLLLSMLLLLPGLASAQEVCSSLSDEDMASYNEAIDAALEAKEAGEWTIAVESIQVAHSVCSDDPMLELRVAQFVAEIDECDAVAWYKKVLARQEQPDADASLLAPALEVAASELPGVEANCLVKTQGVVEIRCADPEAHITLGEASGACPLELSLPIGAHRLTASREGFDDYNATVTVIAGTRETVDVPTLLETAEAGTSAIYLGLRFVPGMGFSSAPLILPSSGDAFVDSDGHSVELDGMQNSQFYYGLSLVGGYALDEMFSAGLDLRLQFAHFFPLVMAVGRARVFSTGLLAVRPSIKVGGGLLYQTIVTDQDEEPVAEAGPVIAGASVDLLVTPLSWFAGVVSLESLIAFPELGVHLGLNLGVEVQF